MCPVRKKQTELAGKFSGWLYFSGGQRKPGWPENVGVTLKFLPLPAPSRPTTTATANGRSHGRQWSLATVSTADEQVRGAEPLGLHSYGVDSRLGQDRGVSPIIKPV